MLRVANGWKIKSSYTKRSDQSDSFSLSALSCLLLFGESNMRESKIIRHMAAEAEAERLETREAWRL